MVTKTDNHNLAGKLTLRRYFLRRYHFGEGIRVLDCCQGSGKIWEELRKEFALESYWGIDVKPKKGRIKADSVRILDLPGWKQNVVDVDTYGYPWKHWNALLPNAPDSLTVFLTLGLVKMRGGNYDRSILASLGMTFQHLKLPQQFGVRLSELGTISNLATARSHGFEIVDCMEADNAGGTARYIGVRLERRAKGVKI